MAASGKPKKLLGRLLGGLGRRLGYGLSLPERGVRSLAAVTGGVLSLLTDTLLPESLRGSSTYRITVGMFQAFLIERVAGVRRELGEGQVPLRDRYVRRKLLGNVLEAAGLLTVRFSPLWVFAIAADAAGGSKVYLDRLVARLKQRGVIAAEAEPKELADVLEAIHRAADDSAAAVDMPPLSRSEFVRLAEEMKASYARVFSDTGNLLPRLDALWESSKRLAQREDLPLEQVVGVMAIDAAALLKKGLGTVAAVGETSVALFDEAILDSYRRTLERASRDGVHRYVYRHLQPFLESARGHLDPKQKSWLEGLLFGDVKAG